MPKKAKDLKPIQVKRLTSPGLHAVGGVAGLHLQVKESGARSWILRVQVGARRPDLGLGGYPDVTLEQAREAAQTIRRDIGQGIDPIAARREKRDALRLAVARQLTFDEAAKLAHATKSPEFSNAKHNEDWLGSLTRFASPVIGSLPVGSIELPHVLKVLTPIWTTKTQTATRVRQRIENVLSWATVNRYRQGENPARWKGNLEHALAKPSKVSKVENHAALPWADVPAFMADLRKREGIGARALEFAILTAARSGEVRLATWDEIDVDAKLWTIPAERMKARAEHRVPLSGAALHLLKTVPRFEGSEFVFPSTRGGGPVSDMTLSAVTRRMGVDAVPHGFRSSFRDWCAESTNYPREVAEQALAHTIENKVEAAYRRGDLLAKRAKLMRDWATFCATVQAKADVTPIRRRG